jgi:anti-sigma B factor antagonist
MAVVEVGAFRAEVVEDPSALVGEIDVATAPSLEAALSIAFSERGNVIVDMAGVTFMGSSGIGELVRARRRLLSVDGNLSVRNAPPCVRQVFTVCGLDELLAEHWDIAAAS